MKTTLKAQTSPPGLAITLTCGCGWQVHVRAEDHDTWLYVRLEAEAHWARHLEAVELEGDANTAPSCRPWLAEQWLRPAEPAPGPDPDPCGRG